MKPFIRSVASSISEGYLQSGSDPTQSLVKVARQHKLNPHEIERVAAQANRNVITKLQKRAVLSEGVDPHFTFPRIDPSRVVAILHRRVATPAMPVAPKVVVDIDRVLPPTAKPPEEADEYKNLYKARQRVEEAKQALCRAESDLELAMMSLSKMAELEMRKGTPIEVFEKIGYASDVFQKTAQHLDSRGIEVVHDDTPFEVEQSHDIVKIAKKIEALKDEQAMRRADLGLAEAKAKHIVSKLRR